MSQPGFTPPQQPPQQQWIQVPAPPPPPKKERHIIRTILIAIGSVAVALLAARGLIGDHGLFAGEAAQTSQTGTVQVTSGPADEPSDESELGPGTDPSYSTYAQIKSSLAGRGYPIVKIPTDNTGGDSSCLDAGGTATADIVFVVFTCKYDAMPVVLPQFEGSMANQDLHYKVAAANWDVYFADDSAAQDFADEYGTDVEYN